MERSAGPEDRMPAARAGPGSFALPSAALLPRLLDLYAAQDTHSLATAVALLFGSPGRESTACAFLDDGSGVLSAVTGEATPPALAQLQLEAAAAPIARVLAQGGLIISDDPADVLGQASPGLRPRRAALCRLAWEDEPLGVLLLCDGGETDLELFLLVAEHVSLAVEHLRALKQVHQFGGIDPVRWTFDREWLRQRLDEEAERARRYQRPLSLLLFQVDNLGGLRAEAGERQAELFLRRAGAAIRGRLRSSDVLAAWGDDGIAVLLPETARAASITTSARIAARIEQLRPLSSQELGWTPCVRTGVAAFPEDGSNGEELMGAAESAITSDNPSLRETA